MIFICLLLVVLHSIGQSPFVLEKLTPFRESVPWLSGQPTVNVPALGRTPEAPPVRIAVGVWGVLAVGVWGCFPGGQAGKAMPAWWERLPETT